MKCSMNRNSMLGRFLLIAGFAAMVAGALQAQEQAVVDRLLESETARFDDLAYCVLVAGGQLPETASTDEAGTLVRSKPWGFGALAPDLPLGLAEYSHLIMQGLGIPGGLMYTIFPGPRYAFQTLKSYDCLFAGSAPDQKVKGDAALAILAEAMAWKEAHP